MKYQKKKRIPLFIAICVSLLSGFLIGYLAGFRYGIKLTRETLVNPNSPTFSTQLPQSSLSPVARAIIEELNCVCGCQMELLPCACQEPRGATEIRLYVQELVNRGLPKSEVLEQVIERYGSNVLKERNS